MLSGEVRNESGEVWAQGFGGVEEADDEGDGEGVGVIGSGREAVIGAPEGEGVEADVGGGREGGGEALDVVRGVDECDGVGWEAFGDEVG